MEPSPLYSAIRARILFLVLVLAVVAWGVCAELVWPQWLSEEATPLTEALAGVAFYGFLAGFLWLACLRAGIVGRFTLGARPHRRQVWTYILLGIPLIATAVSGFYILYLPLSYIFPDFVSWVLLDFDSIIWWRGDFAAIAASGVNVIMMLVIAPVIEEVIFRGFLLNRWWQKYGAYRAVFYSSLIFSFLHVEVIGGMIFGIVLSLIYMKTKSLVGPIVVHASNNAIALVLLILEILAHGDIPKTSIDEFRAEWWVALVGAAVGIPWLVWFCRKLSRQELEPVFRR